jgi:hypothetical protein
MVMLLLLVPMAPGAAWLAVYLIGGFRNQNQSMLARPSPHKTGRCYLYLKRLAM